MRLAGGEIITVVHDGHLGAQVIAAQLTEASEDVGLENECHPRASAQELVDLGADRCLYFLQKGFDDTRARELAACARAAGILTLGHLNYLSRSR